MVSARAANARPTTPSVTQPTTFDHPGHVLGAPGGFVADRMIGWSVTTLTKIEMIQKLENTAHFWMSGIGAIATTRSAKPSASTDAMAGGKRCEYDSTIAVCLSPVRWYSSW